MRLLRIEGARKDIKPLLKALKGHWECSKPLAVSWAIGRHWVRHEPSGRHWAVSWAIGRHWVRHEPLRRHWLCHESLGVIECAMNHPDAIGRCDGCHSRQCSILDTMLWSVQLPASASLATPWSSALTTFPWFFIHFAWLMNMEFVIILKCYYTLFWSNLGDI